MTDTKELNVTLLKFAGFVQNKENENLWEEHNSINGMRQWVNGSWYLPYRSMPKLATSLDAQHKYLWTKLKELGFMIRYQYSQLRNPETLELISDWTYSCELYDVFYQNKRALDNFQFCTINKESPALACALSIEKLIKSLGSEI